MPSTFRSIAVHTISIALLTFAVGCKKGGDDKKEAESEPSKTEMLSQASEPSFTGRWKTGWGPVTLTQSGSSINGTYSGQFTGTLRGKLHGNTANLSWNQTNGESGRARFVLASDGQSFRGTWGSGSSSTSGGAWSGKRADAESATLGY